MDLSGQPPLLGVGPECDLALAGVDVTAAQQVHLKSGEETVAGAKRQ